VSFSQAEHHLLKHLTLNTMLLREVKQSFQEKSTIRSTNSLNLKKKIWKLFRISMLKALTRK